MRERRAVIRRWWHLQGMVAIRRSKFISQQILHYFESTKENELARVWGGRKREGKPVFKAAIPELIYSYQFS